MRYALLFLALASCSPSALQIQAHLANGTALAANDLLPAVARAYEAEGVAVIHAATTREEAEAGLARVRERWRRVWGTEADGSPCRGVGFNTGVACQNGAWQALAATESAWALALEKQIAGQSPIDLPTALRLGEALRTNYCFLRAAVPSDVHLPDPPSILSCGPSAPPSSGSP